MQTMYYTTNNFVRHTGNVVDLSEYRRKLAAAQSRQMDWQEQEVEEEAEPAVVALRPRRSRERREQRSLLLDMWASMGVLVMTITFTLHVLCL